MAMIAYRNKNTGQVQVFKEESSRLEMLNNWERVEDTDVSEAVAEAADRAQAERESIQAASAIRFDTAAGSALKTLAKSAVADQGVSGEQQPQPVPTRAHQEAVSTQSTSLVGALDKQDPARATGATSVEMHQRLAEEELRNPPTTGVLHRAKRDQLAGRTQVGEKAEEKAEALGMDRSLPVEGESGEGVSTAGALSVGGAGESTTGESATVESRESESDTGESTTGESATVESATVESRESESDTGDEQVKRPTQSADKHDWVAYAVSQGETQETATGMTRQQLIDKYGKQ